MRTLVNMVDRLHDEFDFRVITRDHDGPANRRPYSTVKIDEWNRVGNAEVFYLSSGNIRPRAIKQLIAETDPAAIYLNSFFSSLSVFTFLLRRFRQIAVIPIILAPEGELVPGGLKLKPVKKRLYITLSKALSLLDKVIWKAAAQSEKDDVEAIFGKESKIFIAPNMPPKAEIAVVMKKPEKNKGAVSFVFLSRFMRKKNMNWVLEMLGTLEGKIDVDIYGPIEDEVYFEETKLILKGLPGNVCVQMKGPVQHDEVSQTLAGYHFFVLPTLGENFGHIFIEALTAGCPLLISDRSPWHELEQKGIGWDIPLEDPGSWIKALEHCVGMTDDEYRERSASARQFAFDWLSDPSVEESNRSVLRYAVKGATLRW